MIKHVLVPVDGSAYSKKALELGCDLADKYEAQLTILNVTYDSSHDQTMVLGSAAVTYQVDQEELDEAGRQILQASSDLAKEKGCASVKTCLRQGSPVKEILDCCKEESADMIVLGSRGLSDIAGLFLGSVSHKVNHLAECTCITVR